MRVCNFECNSCRPFFVFVSVFSATLKLKAVEKKKSSGERKRPHQNLHVVSLPPSHSKNEQKTELLSLLIPIRCRLLPLFFFALFVYECKLGTCHVKTVCHLHHFKYKKKKWLKRYTSRCADSNGTPKLLFSSFLRIAQAKSGAFLPSLSSLFNVAEPLLSSALWLRTPFRSVAVALSF